jgi:hypothetical protein
LALNGDIDRQEMGRKFLRRIANHFSNEWGIVTPNGQKLGNDMTAAVKKWRALSRADRERLDDLGTFDPAKEPRPPQGGLVLKVFARPLERTGDTVAIYRNPKAHLSKEPGRDHAWLTAAEVKSLVPTKVEKGYEYAVPEAIADRLCRRYLIDLVRIGGEGGPRRRENERSRKLRLTVEDVTKDIITLRLAGEASYLSFGPECGVKDRKGREDRFRIGGVLEYDRNANGFRRVEAVALCETGHFDEIGKKLVGLGVGFELSPAKAPADRVRPHSLYHDYFGKK